MSFDEIVAELPKLTGPELQQIAEKAEFLAGLDEGLRQIAEDKLIPHEEVKEEFRSWRRPNSVRHRPVRTRRISISSACFNLGWCYAGRSLRSLDLES